MGKFETPTRWLSHILHCPAKTLVSMDQISTDARGKSVEIIICGGFGWGFLFIFSYVLI